MSKRHELFHSTHDREVTGRVKGEPSAIWASVNGHAQAMVDVRLLPMVIRQPSTSATGWGGRFEHDGQLPRAA